MTSYVSKLLASSSMSQSQRESFEAKATEAQERAAKAAKQMKAFADETSNWVTQSQYFKDACKSAFDAVDVDKSGSVDIKEMYSATLLIYLKMSSIARGLTPPTFKDVRALMNKVDKDASGQLNVQEFEHVSTIMFKNVSGRVATQTVFAFFLVPVVASYIVKIWRFFFPPSPVMELLMPSNVAAGILSTVIVLAVLPSLLDQVDAMVLASADDNKTNEQPASTETITADAAVITADKPKES